MKTAIDGLNSERLGMTANQTIELVSVFSFSNDQVKIGMLAQEYILFTRVSDILVLMKKVSFSNSALEILAGFVDTIIDLKDEDGKLLPATDALVDYFGMSSDQAKAREIIEKAKGRTCSFGTITDPRVVFMIDVSASMEATWVGKDGKKYTRLSFVQMELESVLSHQLDTSQKFDIAGFAERIHLWQTDLVDVTVDTLERAAAEKDSWQLEGGTNTEGALRAAMGIDGVVAVFFLSDGMPSVGDTDENRLVELAATLSKQGGGDEPIKVNTIALVAGENRYEEDKEAAKRFMRRLADATGGFNRAIEG
eukprot:TRINITY_DN2926_c0_g1_i1.p1 TRINITY_DN2926_c0_g1~~TRINITY_DN2926_c0_g1_i1.p1  ORF type:complete len:348 (+),score=100.92 TRINITY_DN2926_c0_g1_i1:118-1044(+)